MQLLLQNLFPHSFNIHEHSGDTFPRRLLFIEYVSLHFLCNKNIPDFDYN